MSQEFEKVSILKDTDVTYSPQSGAVLGNAPVPPAGGEVEVLGYLWSHRNGAKIGTHVEVPPFNGRHVEGDDYEKTELVGRAHVTQLQADLDQMTMFRDNAANHMKRIRAECTAVEKERDALQAELTKARGWAVERWKAEVSQRPLHNVHRRSFDDTWRQVIARLGGDHRILCGPTHDELLAHQSAPAAKDEHPLCLLCLDKKTVPGPKPGDFLRDCPDCCGEEG
jgi:transcriptional antiterminator Rof (Rho-off)